MLWFHPLAWRIRAAHAAACDAVSDAMAADLVGDVATYGRTLARLAVRAAWPAPVHGIAMATRASDVRRRLDALNRKVFRTPLSWRRVVPAMLAGSLLLVLIGGFGVTRAEQDPAFGPRRQPANTQSPPITDEAAERAIEKKAGRLVLRAVAAETNEPIHGVSIEYTIRIDDGKFLKATVNTGEDGSTAIEWPAAATVHRFWFTGPRRSAFRSTSSGMTIGTRSNCLHRRSCASNQAPPLVGSSRTSPASRSRVPRSTSTHLRPSTRGIISSSV